MPRSRWNVFLACMFIGLGIGMIFDQAGAGIIIGMGVGFLLEGLLESVSTEKKEVFEERRVAYGSRARNVLGAVVLAVIGIGFIFGGLSLAGLIVIPEYLWRSLGALIIIALGIAFLLGAFHAFKE